MPKANVFNMAGQQVGEIELSEAVFGIEPNEAVPSGYPERPDPRRGFRRRQEALASEGHRSRPSGFYPCSPVDSRRHCVRPQAPGLQLLPE